MSAALAANPCRRSCAWVRAAAAERDGLPLFHCLGCGSEWVRSQAWTPASYEGVVPADVAAERARDSAERRPTSEAGAVAAARAGTGRTSGS